MKTAPQQMDLVMQRRLDREVTARKEAERLLESKSSELYFLNKQLQNQRDRLDILNTEMTDSLAYSKRIQQSLLPRFGIQSEAIKDHFIFYKPKDIVSGDFYWQHNNEENQRLIVATADCTGHGVPGAFMSIIGKQGLDLAVVQNKKFSPAEILHDLNNHLGTFLQKELNKHITDGMDISIYCIDYSNPSKKKLTYSGALNSIYIVRNEELIEIKADRIALGYDFNLESTPFKDQEYMLQQEDCIYSYTDGYQDQFGGPLGKKLKKLYLKKIILDHHQLPMSNQNETLHYMIDEWTGDLEQVDDMCIIGIRIS